MFSLSCSAQPCPAYNCNLHFPALLSLFLLLSLLESLLVRLLSYDISLFLSLCCSIPSFRSSPLNPQSCCSDKCLHAFFLSDSLVVCRSGFVFAWLNACLSDFVFLLVSMQNVIVYLQFPCIFLTNFTSFETTCISELSFIAISIFNHHTFSAFIYCIYW